MSFNEIKFQFDENSSMIFPRNKVDISIYSKKIIDDVYFIKSKLALKEDVIIKSKSKVDGILLDYNINGEIKYKSNIYDYCFSTKNRRTDIELIKEENSESKAKKGEINKISLVVKKDFLIKNLPINKKSEYIFNSLGKKSCQELIKSEATNYQINNILNQIYNLDIEENNSLKNIFLQSKILELLYFEFSDLFVDEKFENKNIVKFDDKDIEALNKAKNLILSLEEDYTISSLSKKVAINEFKLKTGFNKYFKTSPGKLILEQKMLKAKKLLESRNYNINEVSTLLGYKYQQSFTSSFKKYFGFTPKDTIKKIDYFY